MKDLLNMGNLFRYKNKYNYFGRQFLVNGCELEYEVKIYYNKKMPASGRRRHHLTNQNQNNK